MRIVAGELRGRVIKSPDESTTRPTIDRVRESMFSSINSRMNLGGCFVLDAFGGSGALGIEALSRGAASCVFYEKDEKARRVLNGNLKSLGLGSARARCIGANVLTASEHPLHTQAPFSLVCLDPPYALAPGEVLGFLERLAANGDLAQSCVIAYEHAQTNKQEVADAVGASALFDLDGQKKYGKVGVSYLAFTGKA